MDDIYLKATKLMGNGTSTLTKLFHRLSYNLYIQGSEAEHE